MAINFKAMIINRNSAILGFGLFGWVVVAILALIGCCLAKGAIFTVVGIVNFLLNAWVIISLYKQFNNEKN